MSMMKRASVQSSNINCAASLSWWFSTSNMDSACSVVCPFPIIFFCCSACQGESRVSTINYPKYHNRLDYYCCCCAVFGPSSRTHPIYIYLSLSLCAIPVSIKCVWFGFFSWSWWVDGIVLYLYYTARCVLFDLLSVSSTLSSDCMRKKVQIIIKMNIERCWELRSGKRVVEYRRAEPLNYFSLIVTKLKSLKLIQLLNPRSFEPDCSCYGFRTLSIRLEWPQQIFGYSV